MLKDEMIARAKSAKRESKYIDFKEKFDVDSPRDWCELIKDIVAMANSGGGCILVGVKNDGTPLTGYDVSALLNLDSATLTDKVAKYTGEQFSEFEIIETARNEQRIITFLIYSISIPMIFIRPGTYDVGGGKQKTAFGQGTIYFRHGAKSEPGNSVDIRKCIERELGRTRKDWLGNIRKVVTAPLASKIQVLPPDVRESTMPTATPIRIVDNADAPVYKLETPDSTHPYRQKEIIQIVNDALEGRKVINAYDILCIRRVFKIDNLKPQYYYKSKYGSPQYSDKFAKFIVECYANDPLFFNKIRQEYREMPK